MVTIVIATRNAHKVGEIRAILGEGQFQHRTLEDLPWAPKIVEDANTFAGNATKKAVGLANYLSRLSDSKIQNQSWARAGRVFVLADDSGLEVDVLRGAPGVHSARFAALDSGSPDNSSAADNNAKLLRLLELVPVERGARFRCVLALTPVPDQLEANASPVCAADEAELQTELFEGACEGHIAFAPQGQGGFGYDPLFVPTGYQGTFAQLGEEVKNRFSHRALALRRLKARLLAMIQAPV